MPLVGNLKGTQGTNGADGTVWHDGTVSPSNAAGALLTELTAAKAGDYYLNTTTGDVYKKVQAAGSAWLDAP